MKLRSLAVLLVSCVFGMSAMADECTQTCDEDYAACKEVAETATAKQACEDDVNSCKADCK